MRTAAQRIAAYNARMQSSQIDPVLTAKNAAMMANFAIYVNDFYPKQIILRDWLNVNGKFGTEAFMFEAYFGELYAIDRRFAGPAAVAQAGNIVNKYAALGLVGAELKAVALAGFGWIIP